MGEDGLCQYNDWCFVVGISYAPPGHLCAVSDICTKISEICCINSKNALPVFLSLVRSRGSKENFGYARY